ncbi:hypothetical protein ACIBQX_48300 [Nonomuraea sp. NPDC049714]|uniref:hypothetical protein n=1 Tax=Nonomuraea sp. NPDC049714 TaxID=3364357 RepID=UPI0037BA1F19
MTSRIFSFLRDNYDWASTAFLVVFVAIIKIFGWASDDVVTAAVLLALGGILVVLARNRSIVEGLGVALASLREATTSLSARVDKANNSQIIAEAANVGLERILPHTSNYDWGAEIGSSTEVVILRIRLELDECLHLLEDFNKVLARPGKITIVIHDPRAPAMQLQYREEVGERAGWAGRIKDLANEVVMLHDWERGLMEEQRKRLTIKLAQHYPVQAYIKADERIYTYSYSYRHRGFRGPAFQFGDTSTKPYQFLDSCMRTIVDSAVLLTDYEVEDIIRKDSDGAFEDQFIREYNLCFPPRRA